MKKVLILVFFLFLITGCSVQYNLEINEDLSILEEAKLTGTDEFFANYYKTTRKNVLQSFIDENSDTLKQNNYEYQLIDDKIPYVLVKKRYDNIDLYTEKTILFNGYFDEVKYTKNENIVKIETIGFNENNPLDPSRFDVKNLDISIKCPYKVINHNAYDIDKKSNTYYYHLDDKSNYQIILEFDTNKKFNKYEDMIMFIIIGLLIIIASWVMVFVLKKKNG